MSHIDVFAIDQGIVAGTKEQSFGVSNRRRKDSVEHAPNCAKLRRFDPRD
jgi:hypothetical protein